VIQLPEVNTAKLPTPKLSVMVKFERLSGLRNYRLSRPTDTFFTFFTFFFKIEKNMTFYVFLSCLTRFLEHCFAPLYRKAEGLSVKSLRS